MLTRREIAEWLVALIALGGMVVLGPPWGVSVGVAIAIIGGMAFGGVIRRSLRDERERQR